MKKIITTLVLIGLLAVPALSFAQVVQDEIPAAPFESVGGLIEIFQNIADWIFTALMVLAAIFLVVAGWFFVTAGGNPESVNKARQMLINALIGVAVAVGAKGLIAAITALVKG